MISKHKPLSRPTSHRPNAVRLAMVTAGLLMGYTTASHATPSLSFSSSSQIWGSVTTQYTSALLGDVSFSLNGTSDYQSNNGTTAHASYNIAAGASSLTDPIYDIVTSGGQYGFSYDASAEVLGLNLKTKLDSAIVDINGTPVSSANNTNLSAESYAQWNQGLYIAPNAHHAAGQYGALLVGITLDGNFTTPSDPNISNSASAYLNAGSNFTDSAGVSYNSNFGIYTNPYDATWTGSQTVYKKLLFQYGTSFNLNLYQYVYGYNNSSADFFNTGKISSIELPFGTTLESGAQQAGLGTVAELFGNVTNSATLDAENTNWDFGNNGGGFTPPPTTVPLPTAVWLFGTGLMTLLWRSKRSRQTG